MKKPTGGISGMLRQAIADSQLPLTRIEVETGIHRSLLSRFLNEQSSIRLETADVLAEYLGLSLQKTTRPQHEEQDMTSKTALRTTDAGYINRNEQENLGCTGLPGNDHNQLLYNMRCKRCGHEYRANGSDIFQRKCPKCMDGRPGV